MRAFALAAVSMILSWPQDSRAEEVTEAQVTSRSSAPKAPQPWQPFVLSEDASTIAGGSVAVATGAGYDALSHQAGENTRSTTGLGDLWLNGAVGVADWMELHAFAGITSSGNGGTNLDRGLAELRFRILNQPVGVPLILTLAGGWQMDYQHDNAVEGTFTLTGRPGQFHLTTSFQAAHYFAEGRDGVDMALSAGANYCVFSGNLEAGLGYLAEELEGVVGGDDVDIGKGGRQWFGPSISALVPKTSLRFNLGGGVVWTQPQTGAFVRGSIGYVF